MSQNSNGWNLENSYQHLPDLLYELSKPEKFSNPDLVIFNSALARDLGLELEGVTKDALASLFVGEKLPTGSNPIAQAYAGHQFGGFTMLGDGRAILLGEQLTPSGDRFDIQFKGSGPTPFSRRGDGLAALGPMLREYLISEAMHALGIPTTRSLAVVATGDIVYRETPLQGAVLTRVADSHIRVGTFQYLAAKRDTETLRLLADYSISRHYPELLEREGPSRYVELLRAVQTRQACLIAKWQLVGFIHGVMNTDNMTICGETIDYGPCAFMDHYHINTVFSSIDQQGRYGYGNQPPIGQWNLARFAETLLPLYDERQDVAVEMATEVLNDYPTLFETLWLDGMRNKIGLSTAEDDDRKLVEELLDSMQEQQADFTNTFDSLAGLVHLEQPLAIADHPLSTADADFFNSERAQAWLSDWQKRLGSENVPAENVFQQMQSVNPAIIPRNHRVEEALAAGCSGDMSKFQEFLNVMTKPYSRDSNSSVFREPPAKDVCYQTFCGT